ncbi:MAG: hypothetical protein H6538_07830 [Bacteroidales bacterium]|nr:hypothetical protein [Bacteroidales bacterium]MCB8999773.1 hypothetical protein [Bacteroidales bacterium]
MKRVIFISLISASVMFMVSCTSTTTKNESQTETQAEKSGEYYTCTMHPEVHSDKPGDCPKCGMELVKAESAVTDSTSMEHTMDMQQ